MTPWYAVGINAHHRHRWDAPDDRWWLPPNRAGSRRMPWQAEGCTRAQEEVEDDPSLSLPQAGLKQAMDKQVNSTWYNGALPPAFYHYNAACIRGAPYGDAQPDISRAHRAHPGGVHLPALFMFSGCSATKAALVAYDSVRCSLQAPSTCRLILFFIRALHETMV